MLKMNCPVCGSELQEITYHGWVRDGNSVWNCASDPTHRFWQNARQSNVLFLHPDSDETSFKALQGWTYRYTKETGIVYHEMDVETLKQWID